MMKNHRLYCQSCELSENYKMYFDAPAPTWVPLPQPAGILTFNLQNLIRSSVEANKYFLSVLLKLFKPFMGYHGNNICSDKQTNRGTDKTAYKHNALPTLSTGEGINKFPQNTHYAVATTVIITKP